MNKLNYFHTREECSEFLKQFNFKYYIPYLEDYTLYNTYHVQLNEDKTKVIFCELEALYDGLNYNQYPFYDCSRAYVFETAEIGEEIRSRLKK